MGDELRRGDEMRIGDELRRGDALRTCGNMRIGDVLRCWFCWCLIPFAIICWGVGEGGLYTAFRKFVLTCPGVFRLGEKDPSISIAS